MYPVHFSISNISCLLITSEKSLFLTFIKVYNIIHEAQINTMDINFDHTYTQCLGIHIYTFTKTSNECKLISLEIFFFWKGVVWGWCTGHRYVDRGYLHPSSSSELSPLPQFGTWLQANSLWMQYSLFEQRKKSQLTAKTEKKLLLPALMLYFFFSNESKN